MAMDTSDEVIKDLDRWVEKLMDCKPLSEAEARPTDARERARRACAAARAGPPPPRDARARASRAPLGALP